MGPDGDSCGLHHVIFGLRMTMPPRRGAWVASSQKRANTDLEWTSLALVSLR